MERFKAFWARFSDWAYRHAALLTFCITLLMMLLFGWLFVSKVVAPSLHGPDILVEDVELKTAHENNDDSFAWIQIPDTLIDYPIQQARDNDYYLRRNAEGQEDIRGCIYADYECMFETHRHLSRNLVLYGHTFSDSEYEGGFKPLHQYQTQEFGKAHPDITVTIPDAVLTYRVFSVGCVDTAADYDCIYADPKDSAFQTILDKALARSVYDFGVDVTTEDKILTLSTCTGATPTRLLVVAKLVDVQPVGGDANM